MNQARGSEACNDDAGEVLARRPRRVAMISFTRTFKMKPSRHAAGDHDDPGSTLKILRRGQRRVHSNANWNYATSLKEMTHE
jgi:hypothetical protein